MSSLQLIFANCVGVACIALILALHGPVSVYTDKETGCQYLETSMGKITPRIAADYMHMGCKGVQDNE